MISKRWDVVVVPFPFSDRPGHKRRPALVLTNSSFNRAGHTVLCMITSSGRADWPADVELKNLKSAGQRRVATTSKIACPYWARRFGRDRHSCRSFTAKRRRRAMHPEFVKHPDLQIPKPAFL